MAKQFKTRFSLALFTSLLMNLLRYCYTQLYSKFVFLTIHHSKNTQNNIKFNLRERTIWVPSKTTNSLTPRTTPWHTDHLPYHTFLLTFFILLSDLRTTLPHLIYNSRIFFWKSGLFTWSISDNSCELIVSSSRFPWYPF